MSKVKFVDTLPPHRKSPRSETWDELAKHPGQWAEWWTDNPKSAYTAASTASRNGTRFESTLRDGKAYVRAVPR